MLLVAGLTAGMTTALTFYAFMTKRDFTMYGGLFVILGFAVFALCILSFFMTYAVWWHPLLTCILLIIYGLYLVYDT